MQTNYKEWMLKKMEEEGNKERKGELFLDSILGEQLDDVFRAVEPVRKAV